MFLLKASTVSPQALAVVVVSVSAFGLLGCEGRGCLVDGETYRDGMRWTCADGCNFCSCDDGVFGQTQALCGPLPQDAGDGQASADAGNDLDGGQTLAEAGTPNDASMLPMSDARVSDAKATDGVRDGAAKAARHDASATAALPTTGEQNCDIDVEQPSPCQWANSLDVIVLGEIRGLRAIESPLVLDEQLVDECPSDRVQEGLIVELDVVEQLFGEPLANPTVEVRIGPRQIMTWVERFDINVDSTIGWPGDPLFETGTVVGVGLTSVGPDEYLSLAGEMPFAFDDQDAIIWPHPPNCRPNPVDDGSMTRSEFTTAFEDCPSPDALAEQLRSERSNVWGQPSGSYASRCSP